VITILTKESTALAGSFRDITAVFYSKEKGKELSESFYLFSFLRLPLALPEHDLFHGHIVL
jgi:hypothetical protein